MSLYLAAFKGREAGALGVTYWIQAMVEADTPEQVRDELYKHWDSITELAYCEAEGENLVDPVHGAITTEIALRKLYRIEPRRITKEEKQ